MPRIKHLVLWDFKKDTPESKFTEMRAAIHALKASIPGVERIEFGVYRSQDFASAFNTTPHKDLTQGKHMCCEVVLGSAELYAAYSVHPDHIKVMQMAGPLLSSVPNPVLVLDFAMEE